MDAGSSLLDWIKGWVSAACDNDAMESFFSLPQKNVLNRHSWATRAESGSRPGSNAFATGGADRPAWAV
ncbi:hypothetical protein RL72_00974 [Microbacterium azadirachtae]|uniref:Uncharacterized protein n=1 Tax=Microbacterium azadirachtae TaxID=582680 RepID=A0A0F0L0F9_9MICO|nr:hypothetical protein RL72_00974 [Microbacterium azadirachtae]